MCGIKKYIIAFAGTFVFVIIMFLIIAPFVIDYSMDMSSVYFDSQIICVFDEHNTYVLYNQYGRIDLVKLYPKVYRQPFTVEKTLLEDIILYYNSEYEVEGKGFVITRDNTHWVLDTANGALFKAENDDYHDVFKNGDAFRDMYYKAEFEDLYNPPKYPTYVNAVNDIHYKITYNPYVSRYYLEYYSGMEGYSPDESIRYFKIEPPCIFIIEQDGIHSVLNLKEQYSFSGSNIPEGYIREFEDLNTFKDVTRLDYQLKKVTDNY